MESKRQGKAALWTPEKARKHLDAHAPKQASAFDQIVLLVTVDLVFWCSAARYEKAGPYHFIWPEHHQAFFEHEENVAKIHVTRIQS